METKTIIVLANSTKNGGHCVAGIEYAISSRGWIYLANNYGKVEFSLL